MMSEGLIVKALSGFYEVQTTQGVERCRARGLFRKEGITPLVGDRVRIEQQVVTEILPRKNSFLRPPVSNLDLLVVVAADTIPVTEPFLIPGDGDCRQPECPGTAGGEQNRSGRRRPPGFHLSKSRDSGDCHQCRHRCWD